jgi:hypothetical protein
MQARVGDQLAADQDDLVDDLAAERMMAGELADEPSGERRARRVGGEIEPLDCVRRHRV